MLDLDAIFDDDRPPGGDLIPAADHPADGVKLIETPSGYLVPADLPDPWRELYEERAAIREFDGGQPREHAEAEALKEILERKGQST